MNAKSKSNYSQEDFKQLINEKMKDGAIEQWILNGNQLEYRESTAKSNKKANIDELLPIKQESFDIHYNNTRGLLDCNARIDHTFELMISESLNTIKKLKERLKEKKRIKPEVENFYDKYQQDYTANKQAFNENIDAINKKLYLWEVAVRRMKVGGWFGYVAIPQVDVTDYNDALNAINHIIQGHNTKSQDFDRTIKSAISDLECHYVASALESFGYYQEKNEIDGLEKKKEHLETLINNNTTKIEKLIKNAPKQLAADDFNELLHRFLGRSELTLKFNLQKNGYEIQRNNKKPTKLNISEGEKTAIAFSYFIIKLTENNNKIEDTIIVVDDPISSFDSSHLFQAYSLIKKYCENAKQLLLHRCMRCKPAVMVKTEHQHIRMLGIP